MNVAIPALAALLLLAAAGWSADLARAADAAAALELWRAAARAQSTAGRAMAPLAGIWILAGIAAGLAWRDRVTERGGVASPGAAWVAKRVLAASAALALGWAAGFWRADPAAFLGAAALHAAAWAAWIRNLPPRL